MFTSYIKPLLSKNIFSHIGIACLFAFISIFITYPLVLHIGDYTSGMGDELILSYIQNYVINALFHHPFTLFNAPHFFPYSNSLAYSDSLITSSLLLSFPAWFFHQPIAIHNLTLLFSLTSLSYSVYLLTNYIVKDKIVAVLAGFLVIFSPVTLDKYIHLQVLFIFFVPLSIYFFLRFLEEKKLKLFILCLICFDLQTLNSFLPGYFIAFSLVTIFLVFILTSRQNIREYVSKKSMLALVCSLIILLPFILPYYQVASEFSYSRDIRDSIHFANQPEDFLFSSQFTKLSSFLTNFWHRDSYPKSISFKNGFPGIVLLGLSLTSLIYIFNNRRKLDYKIISLSLIACVGFILSLGPFLHINRHTIHHPFPIPLPYALFYYLLPGFNGMRNSARWEELFIIGASIGGTVILHHIIKKYSSSIRLIIVGVLMGIIIGEYTPSITFQSLPEVKNFPLEYEYSKTLPDARIIEMPIYNWNMSPYAGQEYIRQYYSINGFQKRMNGVSGFSPPPWQAEVTHLLKTFPDETSLTRIKKMGINTIIVHPGEYNMLYHDKVKIDNISLLPGETVIRILDKSKSVTKIKSYPSAVIYSIK